MGEFCNEDTESAHMGITTDGTMQGTMQGSHLHALKTQNGATICAGPEPSESPVAFSLEGLNTKETPYYDPHLTEALSTDFTFLNEKFNEGEAKQSNDGMGHLGPRALNFQDETVTTGGVSEQMQVVSHVTHGVNMEVDGLGEESTTGAALAYEIQPNRNGHPGFSSTNPFAEGLEPLAGEDMVEQVPIDFTDPAFANLAPKFDEDTPAVDPATDSLDTLPEECEDGLGSTQDTLDSDVDEDDDDMNSCVKRMSFDFSDGKQVPKFRAGTVQSNLWWAFDNREANKCLNQCVQQNGFSLSVSHTSGKLCPGLSSFCSSWAICTFRYESHEVRAMRWHYTRLFIFDPRLLIINLDAQTMWF